jgi:hypothetical protein
MTALLVNVAVDWLVREQSAPRILLALPALPLLMFIVAMLQAVGRMDEMQRRICLESASIAFVLTLALAFVHAGLNSAGILPVAFDLGSISMFLWACAYVFSSGRYR